MTNETTTATAPESGLVASTLAYVRAPAGVVQLTRGDKTPADADTEHVAKLAAAGVLVTADELKKLDREAKAAEAAESKG